MPAIGNLDMKEKTFDAVVLARARRAGDREAMSRWEAPDVLACAEKAILGLLSQLGLRGMKTAAAGAGLGSPHVMAKAPRGGAVGVYLACISSPASYGALTVRQFAWCGQHPAVSVWLLPCVVEALSDEDSHCVVRSVVCLREGGQWEGSAEARQFLPVSDMGENPYAAVFGTASKLKSLVILREVANRGKVLFPYIEGLAGPSRMPAPCMLKGSGDEAPIMLALSEGLKDGCFQLAYGDFYSWANPVNELEVCRFPLPDAELQVELLDRKGAIYLATMAEAVIFPGLIRQGMHFRWAVSLLVSEFSLMEEAGSETVEPSFMQSSGDCYSSLVSRVESIQAIALCGMPGYCIQARVDGESPDLLFNAYVFEAALKGEVPRMGDAFGCKGFLYAVPDALVDSAECWADFPPAVAEARAREKEGQELPALDESQAAALFASMMSSHDFHGISPCLAEEVHYRSETASLELFGKKDLLRHLRDRFDEWDAQGIVPLLGFHRGSIMHGGIRRPCTIAAFRGKVFSATVFRLAGNRIAAMESLAGEALMSLELVQEKEPAAG